MIKTRRPGGAAAVARTAELSLCRRGGFLLASSYAATCGMLRHNGRSLDVSDLANRREHAFDLLRPPLSARVRVTGETRRVNQPMIGAQLAALAGLYHYHPD